MPRYMMSNIDWDTEADGELMEVALPRNLFLVADDDADAFEVATIEYGFHIHGAKVELA